MNTLFCALDKKEIHRVSGCSNAYEFWRKLEIVDKYMLSAGKYIFIKEKIVIIHSKSH